MKEITAYQAEDGSVHPTEQQACRHDAEEALKKLGIFNEATRIAVIQNAEAIYTALKPFVFSAVLDSEGRKHAQHG